MVVSCVVNKTNAHSGVGRNSSCDEWAHERAGIPQAEEGAEVLGVSPSPAGGRGARGEGAVAAATAALTATAGGNAFPDQTALDAMIESIAPDMLQGQAVAALMPVLKMIAASADYAEVHAALAGIFPGMDTPQLEETLARAMFVAEVWGRLSAGNEK